MANPRQRRKQRSGTAKNTLSKGSRKSMKKVVVKAPEVLIKNWDKTKTIRQNYAALGLLPNLNPRQAGGIEPVEAVPYALRQKTGIDMDDLMAAASDDEEDDSEGEEEEAEAVEESLVGTAAAKAAQPEGERKLAKGEGRIIRDENGKITGIVYGGDDGEEISEKIVERVRRDDDEEDEDESDDEEAEKKPWGEPMAEWSGEESDFEMEDEVPVTGPRSTGQGIPIDAKRAKVHAKTAVVEELERLAATQRKVERHTSAFEGDWLMSMVAKYDDDVEKMARDRKINPWQKTAGEIKRAITKAGGFSKMKAKLARLQAEHGAAEQV